MTGHINVMLVLQSCTVSLQVLPGSSSETFPTPSDGTFDVSNTAVQQDAVAEEGFMALNEESPIGIKQEVIPEDIFFPDIKTEHNEVSYVCVCVIRHNLPVFSNVNFFVTSVFLDNSNSCTVGNENVLLRLFFWGGGRVSTGWVGLCVIAEKTKIYPHFRVVKNPYPQNDS